MVRRLTKGKSTSIDDSLYVCEVCSCQLSVKVWVPEEVLTGDYEFPEHCWQNKE